MKVLVTGADGFIGSHVVELMVAEGFDVRAYVYYNSFNDWGWLETLPSRVMRKVEVYPGDVRDYENVDKAVKGVQAVCHLAALIGIPYSYVAPNSYEQTNVQGTLNILNAVRRHKIKKLVHTSTSEVYGSAKYVPIDENHPIQTQSPYAASKSAADLFVKSYADSFGVPAVIIRPFNTFGPRQSVRAVIPTIIAQVLSGVKTLRLGSLHPVRDFTYVRDTARAFVLALRKSPRDGRVINLGTGKGYSIGEIVDKICDIFGCRVRVVTDRKRVRPERSEVDRLISDNSRAREELGWIPRTSFDRGLKLAIEHMKKFKERNKAGIYNI